MYTASTGDAWNRWPETLNRAAQGKERVVLTRRGKGVAVLVPMEDLELLEKVAQGVDLEEVRTALASRRRSSWGKALWEQIRQEIASP